jgi:hypothetical protein
MPRAVVRRARSATKPIARPKRGRISNPLPTEYLISFRPPYIPLTKAARLTGMTERQLRYAQPFGLFEELPDTPVRFLPDQLPFMALAKELRGRGISLPEVGSIFRVLRDFVSVPFRANMPPIYGAYDGEAVHFTYDRGELLRWCAQTGSVIVWDVMAIVRPFCLSAGTA